MDLQAYQKEPCKMFSIPYCKAKNQVIPDTIEILHSHDWTGQYKDFQRFFRVKHSLTEIDEIDFAYQVISIEKQAGQLSEMINASYTHEDIYVSEQDVLQWRYHETFRESLCIGINSEDGRMIASGIAEYDEACKEGFLEWVQVLPEYRNKGFGKKVVMILLNELRNLGAYFVTVSGNLDNVSNPLELYKKCGFTGDDVWYICHKNT